MSPAPSRRHLRTRRTAAAALAVVLLAGCTDDGDASADPTPGTSTSPTPTPSVSPPPTPGEEFSAEVEELYALVKRSVEGSGDLRSSSRCWRPSRRPWRWCACRPSSPTPAKEVVDAAEVRCRDLRHGRGHHRRRRARRCDDAGGRPAARAREGHPHAPGVRQQGRATRLLQDCAVLLAALPGGPVVPARRPRARRRVRSRRGRRPHRAAVVGRRRSCSCRSRSGNTDRFALKRDQPLRRPRARRGTGTTSAPASTPAPTSTRRSTGSPARTATTSRQVPARPADRAGRRARLLRAGGRGPRLPARDRARQGVGGASTGRCPTAAGCSTAPAGTPAPTTRRRSSTPTRPARTRPGISVECARWLAEETPILGLGAETVGTDAGAGALASTRRSRATRSCWAPASTA